LFRLINGREKRVRLAALLAMTCDENPTRWIISSLMASAPFQEQPSSEIDAVAGGLVLKVMATGGDQRTMEVLEEHDREAGLNAGEYADAAVYAGIMLLAK
jgi:hypothetical protein